MRRYSFFFSFVRLVVGIDLRFQASAHVVATFIASTAVIEKEKTGASLKVAAAPNDNFPAAGKHLCTEDLT